MRLLTKDEILSAGRFIMIYGPTGCGKTTSILQSCPMPIKYIQTEKRSLKPAIDAADRKDLDVEVAQYESWFDLMKYVTEPANFEKDATIALDSLGHLMNIDLASEIEDETYETKSDKEKKVKPIISSTKMSLEGFGGLSSQMFRLTAALGRLSTGGKVVIVTALMQENPKWDRELAAGPALKGREYPNNMPGFFDMIGLVEPRIVDNGIVYPPRVRFESDGSFIAKFTGKGKQRSGPLDFAKILKG